jgi:hypothetical protein
LEPYVLHH